MQLRKEDIESKKTVGTLDGHAVIEIVTTGGLNMLVVSKGQGRMETLACAPHRAVGRYLASKRHPTIRFTELQKSEQVDPKMFQHLIPKYEALTVRCNQLLGR